MRCYAPHRLDGKQYQLVVLGRADEGCRGQAVSLTDGQAARRYNSDPDPAAAWRENGQWAHSEWCRLRFG